MQPPRVAIAIDDVLNTTDRHIVVRIKATGEIKPIRRFDAEVRPGHILVQQWLATKLLAGRDTLKANQ